MYQVPLTIRRWAYEFSRLPPIKPVALGSYWKIAETIASRLDACPGISQTSLVRGMVRDPIPVMSDLDFMLHHGEPRGIRHARLMMRLRKMYRTLRYPFPILGDISLVSRLEAFEWNSKVRVSRVETTERLIYQNGKWQRQALPIEHELPKMQRIIYFLRYYLYAARLQGEGLLRSSFDVDRIRRYLQKANMFGFDQRDLPRDLPSLFARSYLNLHHLACGAVEETPPRSESLSVDFPLPDCESFEAVSSIFIERFKKKYALECDITETQVPFHYVLHAPLEESFLVGFFERHFQIYSENTKGIHSCGAVFLSPPTARCLARSFPLIMDPGNWGWFSRANPSKLVLETKRFISSALASLVRFQEPALPGIFITNDEDFTRFQLRALAMGALGFTQKEPEALPLTRTHLPLLLSPRLNGIELALRIDEICAELFEYFADLI